MVYWCLQTMFGIDNNIILLYLKLYLLNDLHHRLDTLKLLKAHGNNIKKKQKILWLQEQDLKTQLILLAGI